MFGMIHRLAAVLALVGLPHAAAVAAADKPLVVVTGKVRVLPAGSTVLLNPSSATGPSINLPHGTAPTTPPPPPPATTFDPANKDANNALSNANLTATRGAAGWGQARTVASETALWDFQMTVDAIGGFVAVGVCNAALAMTGFWAGSTDAVFRAGGRAVGGAQRVRPPALPPDRALKSQFRRA